MLKFFKVTPTRHLLTVDVEYYQADLRKIVDVAKKDDPNLFIEDGIFLPSWSKLAADPTKAKGFFVSMLQALFEGKHGVDELNIDLQTEHGGIRVAMMFLPGSMTNEALGKARDYAQQALQGYSTMAIMGDENITNASAEQDVKEQIEKAEKNKQSVLLLSRGMAQRSFSNKKICEVYLAYDNGDTGTTNQKTLRVATPSEEQKIGRVFSLSFDPNRDDKFDTMIIETAKNYKKNHNKANIKEAMLDVLQTVDIFRCTPNGRVRFNFDEYLEQLINRKSLSRVLGKMADISRLNEEEIRAIAEGNVDYFKNAPIEPTEKGKVGHFRHPSKGVRDDEEWEKTIDKVRKVILTITENIDFLIVGTLTKTVEGMLYFLDNDKDSRIAVEKEFKIKYDIIKVLFMSEVLNKDLLELLWNH